MQARRTSLTAAVYLFTMPDALVTPWVFLPGLQETWPLLLLLTSKMDAQVAECHLPTHATHTVYTYTCKIRNEKENTDKLDLV